MQTDKNSDAIETLEIEVCEERRDSPRYAIDLFVLLPGSPTLCRKPGDISLGGVFVETLDPVAKGERFSVLVLLPGSPNWIESEVEVLGFNSSGRRGLHCCFNEMDFFGQRLLARWLDTMHVLRQVA